MAQTLAPTNRKETATAENVDFGKVQFPKGHTFEGNETIAVIPPVTKENLAASTDWSNLFRGCTKLKKAVLPNKEDITNLSRAFENCTALESVTLPANLDKCTIMHRAFAECVNLKSVVIPNLPKCISIYSMLYDCTKLTTIKVGDLGTEVTTQKAIISWFCYNCQSVTDAEFGDLGNCNIENGNYTFQMKNCKNFKVKKLPEMDIPAMAGFAYMSQLTPQSYANIFAALPYNTGNSQLTIYLNATSLNAAKATTGKYTATDVYDTTTKKKQSKSLTINDWITVATNKGWIINS